MTNHVHLVLVPGREDSLEVLLWRLHGRYAQMVNIRRMRTGHLFQNRFFSCALSASHLLRTLAYTQEVSSVSPDTEMFQAFSVPLNSISRRTNSEQRRRAIGQGLPEEPGESVSVGEPTSVRRWVT